MPSSRVDSTSAFAPGNVVRMAKARRFGIVESIDASKSTAVVAWFEVDPAGLEDPHKSCNNRMVKKSGKSTHLRYLIKHDGPIPAARLTNAPEKRPWYATARANLNDEQKQLCDELIASDLIKRNWTEAPADQREALALLAAHGLSFKQLGQQDRKWTIQNSQTDRSVRGLKRRVDYQCSCGVYNAPQEGKTRAQCVRAWPFEGCLAMVRITYVVSDVDTSKATSDGNSKRLEWEKRIKYVESMQGYLTHTHGCLRAAFNPFRNKKLNKDARNAADAAAQVQRGQTLTKEINESLQSLVKCAEQLARQKTFRGLSTTQQDDFMSMSTAVRELIKCGEFQSARLSAGQANMSVRGESIANLELTDATNGTSQLMVAASRENVTQAQTMITGGGHLGTDSAVVSVATLPAQAPLHHSQVHSSSMSMLPSMATGMGSSSAFFTTGSMPVAQTAGHVYMNPTAIAHGYAANPGSNAHAQAGLYAHTGYDLLNPYYDLTASHHVMATHDDRNKRQRTNP